MKDLQLLRSPELGRELVSLNPWLRRILYFASPALVLGALWWTVFEYYYVPNPTITIEMIERGRQMPSDSLLDELSSYRFFDNENGLYTVEVAEKILRGELTQPGQVPTRIRLPFDPQDIDQNSTNWELYHARLIIPRILLAAYRATGREEFFDMARDVILGWASYERGALLPRGELWGDHAISERALALADFWTTYRHHSRYDPDVAETLFVFAARSGRFLADPAFFYRLSNHGIMQNLALWHLSLAFPSIPESHQYSQLASDRLGQMMNFYINEEGFVLEHSPGYQKTGVQFLSMAFRYMTLLGMEVPREWQQKYEKAKEVYARLRRPDGSLPMIGDTEGGFDLPGPLVTVSDGEGLFGPLLQRAEWVHPISDLYPIAGYSLWWNGLRSEDLSQTVVAWSYFPGFAHKHADEMSVLLWARGQTWWTNVGYWPYGSNERGEAESWNGSNAPHLRSEPASSVRKTTLLGHARGDGLAFIDLERKGPQAYIARRQVAQMRNGLWLVLDYSTGDSMDRTTTLWTTAHDVELKEGTIAGSYELRHTLNKSVLSTFIFGSSGTNIRRIKGSQVPFAGWQIAEFPRPAWALMVDQPSNNSWAVAVWSLSDEGSNHKKITVMPSMHSWEGPETWTITIPTGSGTARLSREGSKVFLLGGGSGTTPMADLTLASSVGVEQKIVEIQSARDRLRGRYPRPRFVDAIGYRFKVTYYLMALLVMQEAFFVIYKRFTSNRYFLLRGLSAVAWIVVGIWLVVRVPLI
jgi:hypothetical protein